MDENEILVASYAEGGNRKRENYDLENRLFYNLKANSIFKEKAPTELIFQKRDNTKDKTFIYEYTIEDKRKTDKIKKLSDENRLASWENVELKISIPNNPERYFASMRSKEILFNKNEGPNSNTVIRYNAKP